MPSADAPTTAAPPLDAVQRRKYASTVGGLLIGGLVYFALLLDFDHHWDRLATGVGFGANFFDIQATALRHGHLWIPDDSLGIEGFEVRGHTYMYFGIFPALLRIPVQLFTDQFEARLTLPSMALAWVVFAVMTARLYWLVRHAMGRPREVSRIDAGFAVVFLALVTGGSVIAFDASLPWVYHEVYLWSVATVVGSLYWLLRVVLEPDRRSIAWLAGFALAAALTRTTGGWAVCLAVIAVGVWIASGRAHPRRGSAGLVLAAGLVPLLAGIVVNWIRFRHPYLFPLEDQVFTQLNQHRRDALAANGGTLVGTQFLPTTISTYFNPGGIRFVDYFPWITLPAHPASAVGDVVVDQSYRTGSITSFMPLLLLGTLASVPVLFRRLPTTGYRGVRVIWLAGFVMTGGVMDYGYLAYRYTSEFIPVFVVGTAVAVHALTGGLARRRRARLGGGLLAAAAVVTAFGVAANGAVAFQTAAITYRGEPLARYLGLQADLTGGTASYRSLVGHGPGLPSGGRADDLWIRGSCDGLYVNTGETDEPWVLVEDKDLSLLIRTAPVIGTNQIRLMSLETSSDSQQVWFETLPDDRARFFVRNRGGDYNGQVFDLQPGATVRVGLRTMSELGYAEVGSTPGGFIGYLKATDITKDFKAAPTVAQYDDLDPRILTQMGIGVTREKPLDLPLCRKVAAAAGVDTTS